MKKPPGEKSKKLSEIIKYIRSEVACGRYPTRVEIESKFHTNLKTYGLNIRRLYKISRIEYKRDPNPFLRLLKERLLIKIAKKLFAKKGYKVPKTSVRPSGRGGPDLIIENKQGRLIPVEIKAYQKFGRLGQDTNSNYMRDEMPQLKGYIEDLKSTYGYLVTSTDRRTFDIVPSDIKILFARDLQQLLRKFKMDEELKMLEWIRNTHISFGKEENKRKVQEKILNFVRKRMREGRYVSRREVAKKFRVGISSYFSKMSAVYEKLGLDPILLSAFRKGRNFDKEKFKDKIISFVKDEVRKGRYPTYKDIQRELGCLPKLFFSGGIREIYKLAGVKYYRKFASKTQEEKEKIRRDIIAYIQSEVDRKHYPTYRDIRRKFKVAPGNYFGGMRQLYSMAGVKLKSRQGLKDQDV